MSTLPAEKPRRRGRRLIIAGIILMVAALGVGVGALGVIRDFVRHTPQPLQMPGEAAFEVSEPGTRYVFVETGSAITTGSGVVVTSRFIGGANMTCTVTDPAGKSIPLRPMTNSSMTYTFGDRQGEARFAFDAQATGTYTLSGQRTDGSSDPFVLAVGSLDILKGVFRLIAFVVGVFLLGGVALVLLVVGVILWAVSRPSKGTPEAIVR
jgi:hypothetical protein